MEEGFVLMNLSKYKRWRALLHRVIAEQQSKRKQTHPACSRAVEKCKKVESVNTQNDYETTSKKWTDKRKADWFYVFRKCLLKASSRTFKRISKKIILIKKRFLGKATGHNDH